MQRIAMISDHASPLTPPGSVDSGGQNVYVAQLARRLGELGHRVDVFTRRDTPFTPPVLEWLPNVRVIHVPAGPARYVCKEALLPAMDEFGDYLHRFLRREPHRYDVIHANFFMSGYAARTAARAFRIPLVMTFHGLGRVRRLHQAIDDRFPIERLAIEAELVGEADRVIAQCPQDRDDLLSLYGADTARLDVVPCGYDPDELPPMSRGHARHALGWDPAAFTLLHVGRIVPRKGIDNVVHALARLVRRYGVDARLYVVGGNADTPDVEATPEIGRLRDLARRLGVAPHVSFLGRRGREHLSYLYHASDVLVTTPWYETFGMTPIEAMACGVPVVGSRVGGIPWTVAEGRTGLLVPPQNPEALAAALRRLHDDPALRASYGRAGRARARRCFTWNRIAASVLDAYGRARRPCQAPQCVVRAGPVAALASPG